MLTCKKLVESGSEYVEGDMSRWQRMKFKAHMFMCKHCTRYIRQLKQTIAMIGISSKKEPPQELQDTLNKEFSNAAKDK